MKEGRLIAIVAAVILISTAAIAQDRHDSAVMVVDVSETTSSSDDITQAKRILSDMNSKFPGYVESAGLMVFGNLTPPTSEWIMPVTDWDRSSTANAINRVREGKGGTAIGASLQSAAPGVEKAEGKTALIIVSDGKDNGQAGPVEVIGEMKAKHGEDLCVFTIQLGDDEEGADLLSDMASAGRCGISRKASMLRSDDQVQEMVDYIFPTSATKPKPKPRPKDSDGDGVFDKDDQCPGTLEGAKVDSRGCWVLENVRFASGSAEIQSRYYSDLDNVVTVLKKNSGIEVVIEGHTDSQGSEESNQELSQKRAEAVMGYFVDKGISQERISAKGHGEARPIADNETAAGRAENRRIEIQVKQ